MQLPVAFDKIFVVKLAHSIIFVFESACLVYLLYAGLVRAFDWVTLVALSAPLLNGMLLAINKGTCPLRTLVENMGVEKGSVTDIFLPDCIARNIFRVTAPPLLVEIILLAGRYFTGL